MDRLIVAKVGGSLFDLPEFPGRLRAYCRAWKRGGRLVLVAGGGAAADFVRSLDFAHKIGDKRSHELALRALDLTAHALACLAPGLSVATRLDELAGAWDRGETPVFSPRIYMEAIDSGSDSQLPESWSTTTDSIAARLATVLEASELHLLKSAGLEGIASREEAAGRGFVDPNFPEASRSFSSIRVVNLRGWPVTFETLY